MSRHLLGRLRATAAALRDAVRGERTPAQVFGRIYRDGHWGGPAGEFYSGYGSHRTEYVEPYVAAVSRYLGTLPRPPLVVDIGCGDFAVADRLTGAARGWIGCDAVPALIERNRRRFARPGVTFELLDALVDPLPPGDAVVVRHVLQHLTNHQVHAITARLRRYPRWIVTEQVPSGDFEPNRDKPMDGQTRLLRDSGVVLTAPPFAITPDRTEILCEVAAEGGVIRTVAYEFDRADARPG